MKKLLAPLVVFAALTAWGCAKEQTVPPPAENEAAPADETMEESVTEETATETP